MDWLLVATNIGTAIGAGVAAFAANRAKRASQSTKQEVATVTKEMMGPDNEPTVRQLVMDSTNSLLRLSTAVDRVETSQSKVEASQAHFAERLESLETAVVIIKERLGKLELHSASQSPEPDTSSTTQPTEEKR